MPEPGGRQRTFELVPETLVPSRGFIRPMTSKAAKKAHQLATKVPKISKTEQRRLEREKLERHRKEYERERAAAKAKAAREKKAEKAAAEKAARKKARIPEPNKFVRPSQPTISLFVKSGSKRSWKDTDGTMEEITECEEDHDGANREMMSRQIPEESVEKHSAAGNMDKEMKNTVSETAVDDWDEPPSKRTRRGRQISMNDADHAMNIRASNEQPNGEHQVKPVAKDNTGLLVASSRELEDEIESTKEKDTICASKHLQKHQASNENRNESETPVKQLEIVRTDELILEAMPGNVIQSDRADKGVLIDETQKQADKVISSQDVAPMASQNVPQPRDVMEDDEFSFEDDDILAEMVNSPLKSGAADAEKKLNSPEVPTVIPVEQVLTNEDSEDEFGDFPSLSQSGILEQLVSSFDSARKDESFCSITGRGRVEARKDPINPVEYPAQRKLERGKPATKPQLQMSVQTSVHTKASAKNTSKPINQQKTSFSTNLVVSKGSINDSQSLNRPSPKVVYGHEISQDHSIDRDGTVNQDHTIKHNHTIHQGHTVKRDHAITQNHTVKQGHTVNQDHTFNRAPPQSLKQNTKTRTALQERSGNAMPPPKLPLNKIKPPFAPSFIKAPSTARIASKCTPKPKPLSALPPSGTQAFLDSHFDDFFPSPSQQVRELEDDVNDLPSNTQIARELTEDLEDKTAPEAETSLGMFMCTQDLILSSQDLSEIETPSRAAPKRAEAPGPRKRGRFFEEKEEDLVLAAIHESKMMAQQHQPKKLPLNDSFGTDYGDEDFGDEFFVQEKVGTVNNLSIHLSNLTGKAKEPSKRTMQRTNSTVTDYGDDDFSGCSQELLAAIDVAEVRGSGEVGLC